MADTIAIRPIGFVKGGRSEAIDGAWDGVEAQIALDPAQFNRTRLRRSIRFRISRSCSTSTAHRPRA
jgi:hypothetical protein